MKNNSGIQQASAKLNATLDRAVATYESVSKPLKTMIHVQLAAFKSARDELRRLRAGARPTSAAPRVP